MRIEPVQFVNDDGNVLFGMLHMPSRDECRDVAILLLSPGVKMRVAPHQLYVKWAEKLVDLGFPVLRFDFSGLGDSEGEVEEDLLADLYGSIQVGRYVGDTLSSIRWLAEAYDFEKFVMAGLCGGAITGLLAGKSDNRVLGLLALGIPAILDSSKIDKTKYVSSGQLDRLGDNYLRKFFDPMSWKRLLSFKSDYRLMGKAVFRRLSRSIGQSSVRGSVSNETDNTNPFFVPALLESTQRGAKVGLIFSGSDRLGWEYEEKIVNRYRRELESVPENLLSVHQIDDANHILTRKEWQDELMQLTETWLAELMQQQGMS